MRWLALGVWAAVAGAGPVPVLERPDTDVQAGIEALREGDAEAALSHFDRAARARPERGEIHWNRGLALRALGRHDEAKEAFSRALASGGAAREALHGLGHLHAEEGELTRAIAAFRAALERDPDDEVARRNLEALLRLRAEQQAAQEEQQEQNQPESDSETSPDGSDEERAEGTGSESGEGNEDEQAGSEGAGQEEGETRAQNEGAGENGAETAERESPASGDEGADSGATALGEPGEREPEGEAATAGPHDPDPLSRTERILDALRAREKSLQLFRTQDRTRSRRDVDKDW